MHRSALWYIAVRLLTHRDYRIKGARILEMPYHIGVLTRVARSDRLVAVDITDVRINQYGDIIGYTR